MSQSKKQLPFGTSSSTFNVFTPKSEPSDLSTRTQNKAPFRSNPPNIPPVSLEISRPSIEYHQTKNKDKRYRKFDKYLKHKKLYPTSDEGIQKLNQLKQKKIPEKTLIRNTRDCLAMRNKKCKTDIFTVLLDVLD